MACCRRTRQNKIKNVFFHLSRPHMKLLRIWPDEKFSLVLFFLIMGFAVIPNIRYVLLNRADSKKFLLGFSQVVLYCGIVIKFLNFFLMKKPLMKLINDIEIIYTKSLEIGLEEWDKSVRVVQRNLHRAEVIYYMFIIFAINICLVPPISLTIKNQIYQQNNTLMPYVTLYHAYGLTYRSIHLGHICFVIAFSLMILCYTFFEILPPYIIFCVAHYFKFIQFQLQRWNDQQKHKSYEELDTKRYRNMRKLGEIVDEHCIALRMANDVEKIVNPMNLIYVVAGTLILCLAAYTVTILSEDVFVISILYVLKEMSSQYCLSFVATKLISNSGGVAKVVANFHWYLHPPTVRKSFLFIILNSQQAKGITAGKFYRVSLQSFTTILSTSFSYFTLLQTVYE